MSKRFIIPVFALVLLQVLDSCRKSDPYALDARMTLWRKDQIPYGTFYAFEELQHLFPRARKHTDKRSPETTKAETEMERLLVKAEDSGKVVELMISPSIQPSPGELSALLGFVARGNHLFLAAFNWDPTLLDTLGLEVSPLRHWPVVDEAFRVGLIHPVTETENYFTFPGASRDRYFSAVDSNYVSILGHSSEGYPNFVKISYEGGGAVYVHLAPLALSNFFLLHRENPAYYDQLLSYLPANATVLHWNDYYRDSGEGRSKSSVERIFAWMWSQPPLAWALGVTALWVSLILVFGSRRRQRVIPEKPPRLNTSLEFVRTIGRLYFQRRDHRNLAAKMIAHFQDFVWSRYQVSAYTLDAHFEQKLADRTGLPAAYIRKLMQGIHEVAVARAISGEQLLEFNNQLEDFYQKL